MQVLIKNKHESFSWIRLNLDPVLPIIRTEFLFRQQILNDLKFELVKVYSKHLLIPPKGELPDTRFLGANKSDIIEILVLMENNVEIHDFQKLKAVLLKMLNFDGGQYSNIKGEIQKRKAKYRFLKSVLKADKDLDD